MSSITELVYLVAQSPWALAILAALLIIDGFFPFVPGETTVVALATFGASGHGPAPVAVFVVATGATMVGDGIAFLIGRKIGTQRGKFSRRPKVARAIAWASARIEHRPGLILVVAKFLPFARVAVTMTAGASTLSVRRYVLCSLVAAAAYTGYHVVVATTAGALLAANPFLALGASLLFGLLVAGVIAGVRRLVSR